MALNHECEAHCLDIIAFYPLALDCIFQYGFDAVQETVVHHRLDGAQVYPEDDIMEECLHMHSERHGGPSNINESTSLRSSESQYVRCAPTLLITWCAASKMCLSCLYFRRRCKAIPLSVTLLLHKKSHSLLFVPFCKGIQSKILGDRVQCFRMLLWYLLYI